jgi:chaperonin GroES
MKLIPLHDWAVIIPAEAETRTAGGLYIPDTAKEKPEEGVVEAIGPGAYEEEKRGKKKDEREERRFIATVVKPGDRVLYERWAGQKYTIDVAERILVRERSILGWIERQQIPSVTTSGSATSLIERPASPLMVSGQKKKEETAETAAKRTAAKPAKAAAKKSPAESSKPKPSTSGKTGKKK